MLYSLLFHARKKTAMDMWTCFLPHIHSHHSFRVYVPLALVLSSSLAGKVEDNLSPGMDVPSLLLYDLYFHTLLPMVIESKDKTFVEESLSVHRTIRGLRRE